MKIDYSNYLEKDLSGRYITLDHITPLLTKLTSNFTIEELGFSENNRPIHLIKIGSGKKKLLFWSQMHGNESTTTKALFDFINYLKEDNNTIKQILRECTLYMIPILNPDGAVAYTRSNYNDIDLNRDAQACSQIESKLFKQLVHTIKPDFAFNLHGQRTIFSAGKANKSAIVSFLSPAGDKERNITASRMIAMEIIVKMNDVLQTEIKDHIGRYDDGFNINCTGDTLESLKIPTILFEAGHFPEDYNREITRKHIFTALITAVHYISDENEIKGEFYKDYFDIPENDKLFYDIIIRNVSINNKIVDIAVQYTEKLVGKVVHFIPKIVKIQKLDNFFGHREIDSKNRAISHYNDIVEVVCGDELLKFRLDNELFSLERLEN
ncbi:M14 family zinc carboxypeptidase [Aquimarina rhabdastrellae]